MPRFRFAFLALVLLVAQPLLAKTYYVGSCKTGAYPTIGAAVAAVPAGSIVDVCPGTYPEQVLISQPLTLQGIASGGSAQAVITMPASGLATTTSFIFGTLAAQVEVAAAPVNITGITVDGTATSSNCPSVEDVGIFYASGASGTLNEVETRFQSCNTTGIGMYAENESESSTSLTIKNSNANYSSWANIYVCGVTPSTIKATIKGNYIIANNGYGIATDCNTTATISDNVVYATYAISGIELIAPSSIVTGNAVTGGTSGIRLDAAGVRISGNTVIGASFGITVNAAASVISNHIGNSYFGISVAAPGSTVQTNVITQGDIGIEFQCVTATVTGNTINGTSTGFDKFPGTSTGTNKLYNVPTLTTGCS